MPDLEKILKKIESGRQFRRNDLHPEFRALEMSENDNQMIVEGHATTFNEEYELYSFDDWDGYRTSVVEAVTEMHLLRQICLMSSSCMTIVVA